MVLVEPHTCIYCVSMTHLRFYSSSMVETPCVFNSPCNRPPWYRSMFGFQTNPQGVGTERLCAFAIQQERICTITEKPWTHSFVEPGCALWRLSHLLLAAENNVCKEPFANVCHLMLGNFPVVLIGGLLQDWCLSICPESARAAHPRLQENIWQTDKLPNFCLLLIHQFEAPEASSCERLISLTPTPHNPHPVLPETSVTEQAATCIPTEACIDDCQSYDAKIGLVRLHTRRDFGKDFSQS